MILSDGRSMITTHNLDVVSEYINLESGVVIDGAEFNANAETFVQKIISESSEFKKPTSNLFQELKACSYLLTTRVLPAIVR